MENKSAEEYIEFDLENKEDQEQEFCDRLSACLDLLGYSPKMIAFRKETNQNMDEISNGKKFPGHFISTGGKAEGTSLYYESDIDRMYEAKGIICVQPGLSYSSSVLLHLDRSGCTPGYTRVKLVYLLDTSNIISKYFVSEGGEIYISNKYSMFSDNAEMIDVNGVKITKQDKKGPSAPYDNAYIKYDFVFGFQCICPDLIKKWVNRERKFHWPDRSLIKYISYLEGHVVPVANKGSSFPQTEWRICFTKAELALVHSLNEFQVKLYILFKLITKSVLRPLCSEMSSYIVKNIIFWSIETNPKETFSLKFLINRLTDCLYYLKDCLRTNVLKNYMISDRNLFEGRITTRERKTLIDKIDELISEKENMLQHCDKIRIAISKMKESPQIILTEAEKRDKIEKLVYEKNLIFRKIDKPGVTADELQEQLNKDSDYKKCNEELHSLIFPGEQSQTCEETFKNSLTTLLA